MLVDEGSASASEIVTGALQDRKRAKVVGTRTFGKGVFQEIERLPNGGALDITVGEYFTPSGRNLGGGGVRKGAGITPDIQAVRRPEDRHGRGAAEGAGDGGLRVSVAPLVGVLEKHGKHYAVTPFFERGQPRQRRQAASAASASGDLVSSSPAKAAGRGSSGGSGARTSPATCSRR